MSQLDLFGNNLEEKIFDLPDASIILVDNFLNQEESDFLLSYLQSNVEWAQEKMNVYGKNIDLPRLTAWYGDIDKLYTYSGIEMRPKFWLDELFSLKERIENFSKSNFSSVLLNYYRKGQDSVGWHSDNEKELGTNPLIASISLGSERMFQMKHIYDNDLDRVDIPLKHGSLLIMKGTTQEFWQHQIPKTKKDIGPRINLTFRFVK